MDLDTNELFAGQELVEEHHESGSHDDAESSRLDDVLDSAFSRDDSAPSDTDELAAWEDAQRRKAPDAWQDEPRERQPSPDEIRARQLEQQIALQQQQIAQHNALFQQAQQIAEQQNAPRFEDDPQAYIQWKEAQFAQALQQQQQALQQFQVREEVRQLQTHVAAEEAQFAQQHPDYRDAARFAFDQTAQRLKQAFPGASDQQIQAEIGRRLLHDVGQARAAGQSPAQRLYDIARSMGFRGAGTSSRPKAPTTLASAAGSVYDDERSAEPSFARMKASDIDKLSPAEFDRAWRAMARSGTVMPKV